MLAKIKKELSRNSDYGIILLLLFLSGCTNLQKKQTKNRLQHASSPYLKEHADNPVDWHEWGDEALAKAKQENKVLARLAKKGIECYCPFTNKEIKTGTITSTAYLPVFSSYVFAFISTTEIQGIKNIPNVINLAHWHSEPVMMTEGEIDAIKRIDGNYINIKLEKSRVSMVEEVSFAIDSITTYNKNYATIKSQAIKIVLPTLGYTLMAERANINANIVASKKKFSFSSLFSRKPKQEYSLAYSTGY